MLGKDANCIKTESATKFNAILAYEQHFDFVKVVRIREWKDNMFGKVLYI